MDLMLAYSHPEVADFQTLYAEVSEILDRISRKFDSSHSGLGSSHSGLGSSHYGLDPESHPASL